MIIKVIDIYFFRGSPPSPAGPGPDKSSYVCGARSGIVHYNMLAKTCQSVKQEIRSMKHEYEGENENDEGEMKDECQSLFRILSRSNLDSIHKILLMTAISAYTPTIGITCQSPMSQSCSDPCPSLLAVVGDRLLQLGGTPSSSGSLGLYLYVHHVCGGIGADVTPRGLGVNLTCALWCLAGWPAAVGELNSNIIIMCNDRCSLLWLCVTPALDGRLLCAGCPGHCCDANPTTAGKAESNLTNHLLIHCGQDTLTSRVKDEVTPHSMTSVYLFRYKIYANFQVYLVRTAF